MNWNQGKDKNVDALSAKLSVRNQKMDQNTIENTVFNFEKNWPVLGAYHVILIIL